MVEKTAQSSRVVSINVMFESYDNRSAVSFAPNLSVRSVSPRRLRQVAHLKDRFRCVTTDLPGFSGDDARLEKWGYPTDEVVRRIERTVEAAGNGQPIILIAHDWGW